MVLYIDGHHHIFTNQGCHIPDVFKVLTGYNTQEASRHRKCTIQHVRIYNILTCIITVWVFARRLLEMSKVCWVSASCSATAKAMAEYRDYLVIQTNE